MLKDFEYDEAEGTPQSILMKHKNIYIVESVVRHYGHLKDKNLIFIIHWKGTETKDDTDEPWEHLKINCIVHR